MKGNVDFSFIQLEPQREYFIVEVNRLEGVEYNALLDKALAQCFGALEVMAMEEKKEKVYGLVTDFYELRFLQITNEGASYYSFKPERFNDFPTEEGFKTLILYLYDHMKKSFGEGGIENSLNIN